MIMQFRLLIVALVLGFCGSLQAQDQPATSDAVEQGEKQAAPDSSSAPPTTEESIKDQVDKAIKSTEDEVKKIADKVDHDPRGVKALAGILQPIYLVAEKLSFPAFHWVAFALMSAGVFSYALQLVIGKLVVLLRTGFSLKEILSDAVGFVISVVGLVLTTQAAAENSTFTQSPAAVISATVVGAIGGFILYLWGQSQEIEAAAGRSRPAKVK